MKQILIWILSLLLLEPVLSQYGVSLAPPSMNGQNKDFVSASPGAASLGIFGQVPVGNYTGVAQVSVPLYTLSYKELQVPIGLNYHATAGIRPDNFPGPVGLGWALNAGGSITRIIRGVPDYEKVASSSPDIPFLNNPLPAAFLDQINIGSNC
jgi:hypothetical protein